jgi:DNA-directed RNA polymerase subunit E'/Rpb7
MNPPSNNNNDDGLFILSLIEKRITLTIDQMTDKLEDNLLKAIRKSFTNKCIEEGFVHPGSIQIKSYSAGKIGTQGTNIIVLFTCLTCNPPAGLVVQCTITDLTKAGVHAMCYDKADHSIQPLSLYILRDHEFNNSLFDTVKKGDTIQARILGTRFELGDKCINAVAEFV